MSLNASNRGNYVDSALFLSPPGNWGGVVGAMKPGAHLLLFSSVKSHHVETIAAEDNGLEIRDTISYVFHDSENGKSNVAMKLVAVARKPLDGNVAGNVLKWGTGGINVDGCRVELKDGDNKSARYGHEGKRSTAKLLSATPLMHSTPDGKGRWPANLILQDCPTVREMFPQSVSIASKRGGGAKNKAGYKEGSGGGFSGEEPYECGYSDSGSAARFFYSAPCLNDLCSYLIRLVTPPEGTILTNCDLQGLPNDYNYVKDCDD